MANWKWKLASPIDGGVVACEVGSLCAYQQKNQKPGNSYGYWVSGSIHLRTCSKKCAQIYMEAVVLAALPEGISFRVGRETGIH